MTLDPNRGSLRLVLHDLEDDMIIRSMMRRAFDRLLPEYVDGPVVPLADLITRGALRPEKPAEEVVA